MAKNYIDRKVIIWQRVYFSDSTDMDAIKEAVIQGKDIDEFDSLDKYEMTGNLMKPSQYNTKQDDGKPTIEIYKDEEIIYKN